MKQFILGCVLFLTLSFMVACNDGLHIKQAYDFDLTAWHLPRKIKKGETVEIRFTLSREGLYDKAGYNIGYIQLEGDGSITDCAGKKLIDREIIPLEDITGLDASDPSRQVFTLFYTSTSDKKSELQFFVVDNFGQQREYIVKFEADPIVE